MADKTQVFRCDICRRVVAKIRPDGNLIIFHRHDYDFYETEINLGLINKDAMAEKGLTKSTKIV